jgi:hypothetical protein
MIENGFVYAANVSSERIRKQEARRQKKMDKLYAILEKKNLILAETAKREHFNKSELKLIEDLGYMHYLEINEKYN